MKIKILKTLWKLKKTFKKGSVIEVKDDGHGNPLDKYWRNRIKDSLIDNCVKILSKKEFEIWKKEQERLRIEAENKAKEEKKKVKLETESKVEDEKVEEEIEIKAEVKPKESSKNKVIKK